MTANAPVRLIFIAILEVVHALSVPTAPSVRRRIRLRKPEVRPRRGSRHPRLTFSYRATVRRCSAQSDGTGPLCVRSSTSRFGCPARHGLICSRSAPLTDASRLNDAASIEEDAPRGQTFRGGQRVVLLFN